MSQSVLADPSAVSDPTADELEEIYKLESVGATRQAFRAECRRFALYWTDYSFEERVKRYCDGSWDRHLLSVAAALFPDLVPTLNGEFEWIAAFLADLD